MIDCVAPTAQRILQFARADLKNINVNVSMSSKKKKRIVCSFREESRTGAVRLFETILTVYVSCLPLLFALQSMLLKHAICPPAVKELVVPMCSESDADGVIV